MQQHLCLDDFFKLLTDTQLLDNGSVSFDVILLQVVQKISSSTDHLVHTSSGVVILLVYLQVLGQVGDPSCQDSDLYLGRTCIGLMISVSFDNSGFFVFSQHFLYLFQKYISSEEEHDRYILRHGA